MGGSPPADGPDRPRGLAATLHPVSVDRARAAREEYKRRLSAVCHSVARTIGAPGGRPLACLQVAASLLVQALADRGVRAPAQAERGMCVEFGGRCLPWHRLAETLGLSPLGREEPRAAAGLPYTLVRSAEDLDEAVLRIEPPSVVAVDTEGNGGPLLMQVAAADKRGGIHTLMAWAADVEAYAALQELVKGCHRVYVWGAKSDGMAGLGHGDVRNAKLVDLQAHYESALVRQAWAKADLPDWAPTQPANAGIALDPTWAATIGAAMGEVAAKDAMPAPTRKATKSNNGWIATREWTMLLEPRPTSLPAMPYVPAATSPADMLLYAASDAAATLVLGSLMEALRLAPTVTPTVTWTEGKKHFAERGKE